MNGPPWSKPPPRGVGAHGFAAAVALVLMASPDAFAQRPAPPAKTPAFSACENLVDDDAMRDQVAAGAKRAMRAALGSVDFESLVGKSWVAVNFDAKFARIVDAQIAILRQDRAYLERLLDGNLPDRAEEMAKRTTEAVFNSPQFKALQAELQKEIGDRMEPLVAGADLDARTEAAQCVQIYLGRRYAATVGAAFGAEAQRVDPMPTIDATGQAKVSAAFSLAGIVAGMLTIVFRRLVRRVVAAVVRRLAGAIAARLAAWASVFIGAAILIYELIAGAEGVFPIIRDELVSEGTRQMIQRSLVDELSTVAPEQLDARADLLADGLVIRWRKFKANHRAVLDLARRNASFREFLADQRPETFEQLSAVVEAIKASPPGGEAAVLDALNRGLLERALALPNVGRLIENWTAQGVTLLELLAWHDRDPARFEAIVEARLPLHVKPKDLSDQVLDRLLTLGDARAAGRIAAMTEPARTEALTLETSQLLALTTRFDGPQLIALFDALRPSPTPESRSAHLRTLEKNPGLIDRLEHAAGAIAASARPGIALDVLLSTNSNLQTDAVLTHLTHAYEGHIAVSVLYYRYGWGLIAALLVPALVALLILRGLARFLGLVR